MRFFGVVKKYYFMTLADYFLAVLVMICSFILCSYSLKENFKIYNVKVIFLASLLLQIFPVLLISLSAR